MSIPIEKSISSDERRAKLMSLFEKHTSQQMERPTFLITVPLRVCPLGAHSDHQRGIVTGLTINRSVSLLARETSQATAQVWSTHFNESKTISLTEIPDRTPGDWGNYLRGAAQALHLSSRKLTRGFTGILHGDMPIGGLSSSAAVSIAYLKALEHVNNLSSTPLETVALVRSVENGYLGLHNGILDQSVIMSGKRNALSAIDCATQTFSNLPQGDASIPWEILVVYSGLSRQLTATPFNQRVAECHEAAKTLLSLAHKEAPTKPLLGDVDEGTFTEFGPRLPDALRRRATHFFSERARVRQGINLWKQGEIEAFGKLITASGESSIVNFESGSPALIALYEIMARIPGVLGTRFCGGGFQGCALAFIDSRKREAITESLHSAYTTRHPELANDYSMHLCESTDSVSLEVLS
jgi:galactokinase